MPQLSKSQKKARHAVLAKLAKRRQAPGLSLLCSAAAIQSGSTLTERRIVPEAPPEPAVAEASAQQSPDRLPEQSQQLGAATSTSRPSGGRGGTSQTSSARPVDEQGLWVVSNGQYGEVYASLTFLADGKVKGGTNCCHHCIEAHIGENPVTLNRFTQLAGKGNFRKWKQGAVKVRGIGGVHEQDLEQVLYNGNREGFLRAAQLQRSGSAAAVVDVDGWAGGSHCLSLDRKLSMPLEPKLAPCGWRCPHRRPALTGPFGNW